MSPTPPPPSPPPPPPPKSTSAPSSLTSTTRSRNNTTTNNGSAAPPPLRLPSSSSSFSASMNLSQSTKMRRSASVSRSLGAPERVRHLAFVAKSFSKSFDPYSIFMTPHYSDAELARHRGWMRLLPRSPMVPVYVLLWYWPPLCATALVSVAVAMYETYAVPARSARLKSLARSELAVPFQLTSFCLSILLVFRTTASYERWNEARKVWGSVGVEARSLARQARAWVERGERSRRKRRREARDVADADGEDKNNEKESESEEEEHEETRRTIAELLSWCAAVPIALKAAVATDADGTALLKGEGRCVADGGGFEGVLTEKQRRSLWRSVHGLPLLAVPNVLDRISRALARLPPELLSDVLLASVDQRIAAIAALACTADRLKRQPIPPAYTRNTARFLAIWLFFLPLALWNPLRWWSIPACIIISFLLVAVENVGSQLESPHPLLPVDELVSIAVNGVIDAGGKWYLDAHEREILGYGESDSGSDDDDGGGNESDGGHGGREGAAAVAVAAPATKETV